MSKLKTGDMIRSYRLLEDFRMANGANCEWTFAEKDGEHYFVKAFLSPKYPLDGAPGSPATLEKKRLECAAFETHQRKLLKSAQRVAGAGGKLVVPIEFFREGTLFYKVAPKIDAVAIDVDEIARFPLDDKLKMMAATVAALYALHNATIVHGDLKPANILISRTAKDSFNANVIDFDSSYISAQPPAAELLTGDPPFYAPELLSYIKGDNADPAALTAKADIFALGLVFWQFLVGAGPTLPPGFHYACEAVNAGHALRMPRTVRPDVAELVHTMLAPAPASRPTIAKVQTALKDLRRGRPSPAPEPTPAPPPRTPPPLPAADPTRPRLRLKGTMGRRAPIASTEPEPVVPEPIPPVSRVRYRKKGP